MGLDLGLEAAGLSPSIAVEMDGPCCNTIRHNRPDVEVLERNITDVSGAELLERCEGGVFLVAGGPPCQSFSPGGNRASLADLRGNLIYEYFRIVDEVRPQFFIFENVANLVTATLKHRPIDQRPGKHWNLAAYSRNLALHETADAPALEEEEKSGAAIRAILDHVSLLGYSVSFGVVDAADYGAPQHRLRFVMLGSRDAGQVSLPVASRGPGPVGLRPFATVRDAIADLASSPGAHYEYSAAYKAIFTLVPPGGNWRSLPPDVQRDAMGKSFEAGGGKTGFFRRLSWDTPAPTITGKPNRKATALCHPGETRPLSLLECARLQGFPDDWHFVGSLQSQYQQVGNAVPVHLGEALGAAIHEARCRKSAVPESLHADAMLSIAVDRLRQSARNKRSRVRPEQMSLA
jgi:DNA (cytosine-5)-methyltransferase 1